jgi:hypothetical protein
MKTVRRDLMEACRDALLVWPALSAVSIRLAERRPMAEDVNRQIRIFHEQSDPEQAQIKGAPLDWRTSLRIECIGREVLSPAQDADSVADSLVGEVFKAVMADVSLGGRVQNIEPGPVPTTEEEADKSVSAIQTIFYFVHRTQEHTIEA